MSLLISVITIVGCAMTIWSLCGRSIRGAVRRHVEEAKSKYTNPLDEFDENAREARKAVESAEKQLIEGAMWEHKRMEYKIQDLKKVLESDVENREQKEKALSVYEEKYEELGKMCENAKAKIEQKKEILKKVDGKRQELALRQEMIKLEEALSATIDSVKIDDSFCDSTFLDKAEEEIAKKEFVLSQKG